MLNSMGSSIGKKRARDEGVSSVSEESKRSRKRWSKDEDAKLREGVQVMGPKSWKAISDTYLAGHRSDVQCLHRWSKVLKPGLVKGLWTNEEDTIILQCIDKGMVKWTDIADCVSGRSSKQCRERWSNHLDPSLKKGNWDDEEDKLLAVAQSVLGNCWSRIAKAIPGRSENAIKNRWNSAVHKKAQSGLAHETDKDGLKELILQRIETTPGGPGDLSIRRGYVNVQRQGKENLLKDHVAKLQSDRKVKKVVKQEKKVDSEDSLSGREMQLVQEAFEAGTRHQPSNLQLNVNVLQLVNEDLSKRDYSLDSCLDTDTGNMGFGVAGEDGNETDDNSDEGYETDDNSSDDSSPFSTSKQTSNYSLGQTLLPPLGGLDGDDFFGSVGMGVADMGVDMDMGTGLLALESDFGMFEGVF
jgi:hypothetical protein